MATKKNNTTKPKRMEPKPWYEIGRLYNISIELSVATADGKKGFELAGIPGEYLDRFKASAYTQGVLYKLDNGALQLITPFAIKTIYIIPQQKTVL